MKKTEFIVWPGVHKGNLIHEGKTIPVPENWGFVPAGDAALTRRLKNAGPYYVMVHKRKNRIESTGLWTDLGMAEKIRKDLEAERAAPEYRKKLEYSRRRREAEQHSYEKEFHAAVLNFLHFAPRWEAFAEQLAAAVTEHAVPVGSGTVARTSMIPLERRAEAAVIAWMRHQTTAYDRMKIARVRNRRREVRRMLAEHSRELLEQYRRGDDINTAICPLAAALAEDAAGR